MQHTQKFKVTPDNYKEFLPDGDMDLKVQHIHDPEKIRELVPEAHRGAKYATVARLGRFEDDPSHPSGRRFKPITEAHAICCPRDTVDRARGWRIAAGRVLRKYWEGGATI